MHRVHLSAAQHRRRRLALWAGFMTIVVLAATGWFVIEVVWSIITSGAQGRGVLRWAELAAGLVALLATVAVVPWLRVSLGEPFRITFANSVLQQTRRPNKLSLPTLAIAILTFALHLVLSVANIVLVIVWRDELGTRCSWSIDAAWTMGKSGDRCPDLNGWKGWIVAAAVRAIVTVLVGVSGWVICSFWTQLM